MDDALLTEKEPFLDISFIRNFEYFSFSLITVIYLLFKKFPQVHKLADIFWNTCSYKEIVCFLTFLPVQEFNVGFLSSIVWL